MGRTILFSSVGGTDPMSEDNCRDGSLIHILRVYDVDKVILYMSKEMLENQKKDQRYTYCIEQLAMQKKKEIEYEIIEREDLVSVHDFNYFYGDYRAILSKVMSDFNDDDTLLLNISSGTPAMKSALLVLNHLWETKCKSIQVSTPNQSMNQHIHSKDYDVKLMWELNEDNQENFENRCMEVECLSLTNLKNEELIKKLIREYDYDAALLVAKELGESANSYIEYLEFAKNRLLLNFDGVNKFISVNKLTGTPYNPVFNTKERKYFEYLLSLDIKIKKLQYADFIRAITPIVLDLLVMITKEKVGIDIENHLCKAVKISNKTVYRWDESKFFIEDELKEKRLRMHEILNNSFNQNFRFDDFVYSSHLEPIICNMVDDINVINAVKNLRKIDEKRNIVAHEMVCVTQDSIKKLTGFTPKQIMDELKTALDYSGIHIKRNLYDSYHDMNEDIISKMK